MFPRRHHKWSTSKALALLLFALFSCAEQAPDSVTLTVEIEFSDDLPIDHIVLQEPRLLVRPDTTPWDDPWLEIDVGLGAQLTLMAQGEPRSITFALRDLPEGDFEHIFLTASAVTAQDAQMQEQSLENILEPIALVFSTRDGALPQLFLDLIVLEGIEQKGIYMIFAKDAGITDDQE